METKDAQTEAFVLKIAESFASKISGYNPSPLKSGLFSLGFRPKAEFLGGLGTYHFLYSAELQGKKVFVWFSRLFVYTFLFGAKEIIYTPRGILEYAGVKNPKREESVPSPVAISIVQEKLKSRKP